MTDRQAQLVQSEPGSTEPPWRLPRRDYFLLPAIFILTIVVLLLGGEVTARVAVSTGRCCGALRILQRRLATAITRCAHPARRNGKGPGSPSISTTAATARPNHARRGHRGRLRVAVVGSSTARGALVNYNESFAGLASATLSKQCGATVDFQNLGTEPSDVDRIDQRIPEALGLHPSAIVMTIGPFDLIHLKDRPPLAQEDQPPPRFNLGRWCTCCGKAGCSC